MPIKAWSIEDVRAAEAATMAQLPEGELMARAAHGLAMVVGARLEDVPDARVVVLVGSGGNGGDALFAAAELVGESSQASGVVAILLGEHAHEPALDAARSAGVLLVEATTPQGVAEAHEALAEADVVIDGITGIGGRPGLADGFPLAWELVEAIPADAYVVAVDLPSGTDPAGERVVPDAAWADETVTFGVAKPVHVLAGAPACGLLTVIDIGLDLGAEGGADDAVDPAAVRLGHDDIAALWPVPGPEDDQVLPRCARRRRRWRELHGRSGAQRDRRGLRGGRDGPLRRSARAVGAGAGRGAGGRARGGASPGVARRPRSRPIARGRRRPRSRAGRRRPRRPGLRGAVRRRRRWTRPPRRAPSGRRGADPAHPARGRARPVAHAARGREPGDGPEPGR